MLNLQNKNKHLGCKLWVGVIATTIAFNAAPALADDSFGGVVSHFFSGFGSAISELFHSPMKDSGDGSGESPDPVIVDASPLPSPSPLQSPNPIAETPVPIATGTPDRQPLVSHDSSYQPAGTVPADVHWILVDAHTDKQGELKNAPYIGVKEGDPLPKVYLPYGPGLYTVQIYFSKALQMDGGKYEPFSQTQVNNDDAADHSDLMPSIMIQSDAPEIVALAKQLTENAVTDREKALAIHDWIAKNVSYDEAGRQDRSYTLSSFDAISVLHSKTAVCEGYSNLFAALARAAGLKTRVALGKAFNFNRPSDLSDEQICQSANSKQFYPHGWNEVMIDNRWASIDTTLDAHYNGIGELGHENFDRDPSKFEASHLKCSDADW